MTSSELRWQALQPETARFESLFSSVSDDGVNHFSSVQPRLINALTHLAQQRQRFPLLLVRSQENSDYLAEIAQAARDILRTTTIASDDSVPVISEGKPLNSASTPSLSFSGEGGVHFADWIEPEQLFGCVRLYQQQVQPEPGLIHRANGGTLILSLRTLMAQPLMWLRLKNCLVRGQFDWLSPDEKRPLPVFIPPLPLSLKLIVCGERDILAEFQEMEPDLHQMAIYTEFEENFQVSDDEDMANWFLWAADYIRRAEYPVPQSDFWPVLINEGVRYTEDQQTLPLCPRWLNRQLTDAMIQNGLPDGNALSAALEARSWRESYLSERLRDEILLEQVLIETEGSVTGQINGLSVVEYPGHPRAWGEPARITCVVHPGDGEFTDVERKAELGGNIHAKGMMIMQAWLIAELELEQQLPFSASVVFEQSYAEVDGDSASLAELCALISALANQPVNQQIAVTGSVDQFGNVQPVGGLNEKIEGFFFVCQQRGLTGQQGIIMPASNVRHLCLHQDVVEAVKAGTFHIWPVTLAEEALPLLMGAEWRTEKGTGLLPRIQERIAQFSQQDVKPRPWPLRWLNWFSQH